MVARARRLLARIREYLRSMPRSLPKFAEGDQDWAYKGEPRTVVGMRWASQAILVLLASLHPAVAHAQKALPSDTYGGLDKLAKTYKIEIIKADLSFPVKTTHGVINGKSAGEKELQEYVKLFAPEFALYPRDLVRRSKLKRVVLCSELSFADQRRNAIPDFEHDTLYLDVSRGTYNKTYMRKVIHHEFFHIVDYRDDGSVYKDERWESLNPANFKYGSGGRAAQDLQQTSVLTDKFPGLLNHYSTTAVEEDKAELFANLIIDSEYLENRIKKDRVLHAKVERMRELLVTFCPDMNGKFWEKAAKLKRNGK